MTYKLGSLFDGSGGFPLAGAMCGIEPVWASEVEPYPIAVTRERFPNMKHLGDISKINGAKIEPVDVVTFGFPCQSVSVAGKREGVKHKDKGDEETTRSGLFWEAVRIIKEMRGATNGEYPRFAVFENVPGLFSADNGEAFRTVLEGLIQIVEPKAVMPEVPKKGWPYADCYSGDGFSLAYRVFDAQYIRTAQRRRRVYACLDLRGQCARQILFERESLRGYFTQSGTPWKGTPASAEGSVGADDREGAVGLDLYNFSVSGDKAVTLNANSGLSANHAGPTVCYSIENHPADSRVNLDESGKVQTLTSRMGTGGGNVPMVMEADQSDIVYALDRASFNQGENAQCDFEITDSGVNSTIVAKGPSAVCYKKPPHYIVRRLTPTECARLQGFPDTWGHIEPKAEFTDEEYVFWKEAYLTKQIIDGKVERDENGKLWISGTRKLYMHKTPKKMLSWYNKLWTDSAEYKLWGNGIALPCALYVMQGIVDVLNADAGIKETATAEITDLSDIAQEDKATIIENAERLKARDKQEPTPVPKTSGLECFSNEELLAELNRRMTAHKEAQK